MTKLRNQNLAKITQLVTQMVLEASNISYIILCGNNRKWLILMVEWEVGGRGDFPSEVHLIYTLKNEHSLIQWWREKECLRINRLACAEAQMCRSTSWEELTHWKNSDAGRDWGQEEKGTTEDEMAGWHHRPNGREFEWTPGDGDGQGGLACCDSWGRKESAHDWATELNWIDPERPPYGAFTSSVCYCKITNCPLTNDSVPSWVSFLEMFVEKCNIN